jgi:hypothetical protein
MNSESLLLEGVNGNFLLFSLAALVVFAHYMKTHWFEGYRFLAPAIALSTMFLGEVILRGNFWFARHMINMGYADFQAPSWITILGSTMASWGLLCTLAVFAPEQYRTRVWVSTLVVTAAFLSLTLSQVI